MKAKVSIKSQSKLDRAADGKSVRRIGFAAPLYFQIKHSLEQKILSGEIPIGGQVPTEHEIEGLFGVSRITARKALEELRVDDVIYRVRGRGSFVKKLPEAVLEGSRQTKTEIGVVRVIGDASGSSEKDDWGGRIVAAMERSLLYKGYHVTLLPYLLADADPINHLLSRAEELSGQLAGVLAFMPSLTEPLLDRLDEMQVPWVTINPSSREQPCNFVAADNYGGGHQVGLLFANMKRTPVLVMGRKFAKGQSDSDKFFGFLHGYMEGGQSTSHVDYLITDEENPETAWLADLETRLVGNHRPRAIFCLGDILAVKALQACARLDLQVPQDVSIVGGTGLWLSEHTVPPLTVLTQPMEAMGKAAAQMLMELIETKRDRLPGHHLASPLIARASCPIPIDDPDYAATQQTVSHG